jgi:hypothetical protein
VFVFLICFILHVDHRTLLGAMLHATYRTLQFARRPLHGACCRLGGASLHAAAAGNMRHGASVCVCARVLECVERACAQQAAFSAALDILERETHEHLSVGRSPT